MTDENERRVDLVIVVGLVAFVFLAKMVIDYWLMIP